MMITKSKTAPLTHLIKIGVLSLLAISIVGCTNARERHAILEQGPTMKDIYTGSTQSSVSYIGDSRPVGYSDGELEGYTRSSSNEIDLLFPKQNNPEIMVYVFPHLSNDELPIPGYMTVVNMYDDPVIYALPGEL